MKVTVVVVNETQVREDPATRRKVVMVNVILPGGVDIQSVDMKPIDNRKKIEVSCFEEKGMSDAKNCIPCRKWATLNQGLTDQIEGQLQKKLDVTKEVDHRFGEPHLEVVDVPDGLQVESVGLQDPYNLYYRDRRTHRDASLLEAHAYCRQKKDETVPAVSVTGFFFAEMPKARASAGAGLKIPTEPTDQPPSPGSPNKRGRTSTPASASGTSFFGFSSMM